MEIKQSESSPENTYWKLIGAALELEAKRGHLKWTISDLSRRSGVTRSLIYYHFGHSKVGLLLEAVKTVGERILKEVANPHLFESEKTILGGLAGVRSAFWQLPFFSDFYFYNRKKVSELGDAIRELECQCFQQLDSHLLSFPTLQKKGMMVVLYGAIFSPIVERETLEFISRQLENGRLLDHTREFRPSEHLMSVLG